MDPWRDNQRSRRLGANMRYYRGRTTNQFDDMVTRMGSSDPMTIDQYDWEEDTNDPQERKMIHKPTKPLNIRKQQRGKVSLKKKDNGSNRNLIDKLMNILVKSPDYCISLLKLLEDYEMNPGKVKEIISNNSHCFKLEKNDAVKLDLNLEICGNYTSEDGCSNRMDCSELHLCSSYLMNCCDQGPDCIHGHKLRSNHNLAVLIKYNLNNMSNEILKGLIGIKKQKLFICIEYNESKCNNNGCLNLHVCIMFLLGKCFDSRKCKLKHNFSSNKDSLARCGISINDAPVDVKNSVLDISTISTQLNDYEQAKLNSVDGQSSDSNNSNVIESVNTLFDEKSESATSPSQSAPIKIVPLKTIKKKTTSWSHHLIDYSTIAEICYKSVESKCDQEANGCSRLHATQHYHWQLQDEKKRWLNMLEEQAETIEYAFCCVEKDVQQLPVIDPSLLKDDKHLWLKLLGRIKWEANLKEMHLVNSTNSEKFPLRRLSTEIGSGIPPVKQNEMIWYFISANQQWVPYGTADSTNRVSNVSSSDIEQQYQSNSKSMQFQNNDFTYNLDFSLMQQINTKTNTQREVKRRPAKHIKPTKKENGELPDKWDPMDSDSICKRVVIAHGNEEFIDIENLIKKQNGTMQILKLERIQNPYLWSGFNIKIKELEIIHKNADSVNIRQLFHGTKAEVLQAICEQNFDWRLYGTAVGNLYGKGSYFSPYPKTASSYANSDANGLRYMFVARVAVGKYVVGDRTMSRPPINTQTNRPYDSTVDRVTDPNIIVKYDGQEYYPEYIVTFK